MTENHQDLFPKRIDPSLFPEGVHHILDKVAGIGQNAWLVGGCVRDLLMHKRPWDWDICTDATPDAILTLFEKTVPTGLKHGTVSVVLPDGIYEVTTLRVEGEYLDSRRPSQVHFTTDLTQDLSRRDFTMNSIAVDRRGMIHDPFSGVADISARLIRAVGDASLRFQEDGLRMLRALRFQAQLGFQLDPELLEGIKENGYRIRRISAERIRVELDKLLCSDSPEVIYTLEDFGLLSILLPEVLPSLLCYQNNTYHEQTVSLHTSRAMKSCENSSLLRWTVFLHDIGKPFMLEIGGDGRTHFYRHEKRSAELAEDVLKRLRFPNEFIQTTCTLIEHHGLLIEPNERSVRRAIHKLSEPLFPLFLEVQQADIMGQAESYQKERLQRLEQVQSLYTEILEKDHCLSVKDLAINGKDLIQLGVAPGKEIGRILDALLDLVLEDPEMNHREKLLGLAMEYRKRSIP